MITSYKNKNIYLVCGVSGAGKTWVCNLLTHKFNYIPHDLHFKDFYEELVIQARKDDRPIVTECPFGERIVKQHAEGLGFLVIPVFVVERPELIAMRYFDREGKAIQKAAYTRAFTIIDRAKEWGAFYGTSKEVLEHLQKI